MYRCELHDIPRFFKARLTDNSDVERVKVVIEQAPFLPSCSGNPDKRLRPTLSSPFRPNYLGERYFIRGCVSTGYPNDLCAVSTISLSLQDCSTRCSTRLCDFALSLSLSLSFAVSDWHGSNVDRVLFSSM